MKIGHSQPYVIIEISVLIDRNTTYFCDNFIGTFWKIYRGNVCQTVRSNFKKAFYYGFNSSKLDCRTLNIHFYMITRDLSCTSAANI